MVQLCFPGYSPKINLFSEAGFEQLTTNATQNINPRIQLK